MISRNNPCPCGSGKLYKRCCGVNGNQGEKNNNPLDKYNTIDILQCISALTLIPVNHGKNIRLENVAREAVIYFNTNKKKISVLELQSYLNTHYAVEPLEDPTTNIFTEVIAFHGGDYLILPGIIESPSFILNNLISAIFNWPQNNLKDRFKSNVNHTVHAILTISNAMLLKAGFSRYMAGEQQEQKISFVPEKAFESLKKAVWFSAEEMKMLMEENHIVPGALKQFIAEPGDPSFKDKNVEESLFVSKPLLATKEGYLVASPASLCYALINAIKEQARLFNCTDELHNVFHAMVWNTMQVNLKRLNFIPVEIQEVPIPEHDIIKTGFYTLDDDKLAIIRYIPLSQGGKVGPLNDFAKGYEELFTKIKAVKKYEDYQFMDLTIPSVLGNDLMFPMMGNKISQTLVINTFDFDLLCNAHKYSALDLWKFSLAREKQVPRELKMMGLTFLDEFNVYKEHGDSFYLSDEGFDLSKWTYGNSQSLVTRIKQRNDEHCMAIRVNDRLAKTFVARRDKYSPTYLSIMDLMAHELQFAIEGFGTAIWVKPIQAENASASINHFYWELTDAIGYWLWQICDSIKHYIQSIDQDCLFFTFELGNIVKFEELDDDFSRDKEILKKLVVSSSGDTIHLIIPHELIAFFYGSDNEGDRLLVRQLLSGINDLLAKKGSVVISENEINTIVERHAPLGMKKKLVILHSRSNLLLDGRNLSKPRYVEDYDTSTITNSIGKLLGANCPPVGEITDIEEKKKLTRNIVMRGLLPHLKATIDQYDNEELIKRLIALNESLIHDRELKKIHTPTRIACFVSQDQHTEDIMDTTADISRTTIAVRCLLEHLAAEPAKGIRRASKSGTDELIAIMDAIIYWGSIGDQLTFSLFDIRMGVLPTGRIGTQKDVARNIFDPYQKSKTKETIEDAINSFEQEFPTEETKKKGRELPPFLDKAFLQEFNISFTRICSFIDILADQGFQQETAYAVMDRKTLLSHAEKYLEPFTEEEFEHALSFLGLVNRGTVENIPKGHEGFDISPWRFNRRLSLLRKPVIICNTNDATNPILFWGPRQVLLSRITLADQCFHDRFKVSDKSPVKQAMGRLSNDRGTKFVLAVLEKLQIPKTILDSEVTISKKGKLKHHSDIGDIDILLIDLAAKRIYNLECKSFAPSRNIKEMIEECEKLLGSRSEKGLIEKHAIRHEWIKQNLKQIGILYKQDLTGFEVKSSMITREDMLFPYVNQNHFGMPFITQYDLEKNGFSVLQNL